MSRKQSKFTWNAQTEYDPFSIKKQSETTIEITQMLDFEDKDFKAAAYSDVKETTHAHNE